MTFELKPSLQGKKLVPYVLDEVAYNLAGKEVVHTIKETATNPEKKIVYKAVTKAVLKKIWTEKQGGRNQLVVKIDTKADTTPSTTN